jgi:endo-1,4-beta-xylanase
MMRRALPAILITVAAAGCGRSEPARPPAPVESTRPLLGAAVDWEQLRRRGPYQALFLAAGFEALTPENEMKMDALAPAAGTFSFAEADALVRWAQRRGIAVHGHTLVWHEQLPGWLTARSWTRDELIAVLRRHVQTVVGHFRGRVRSWDVVNEPLAEDGTLRRSLWARVIGPDYVARAVAWAREADPEARLVVNDFNVERRGAKADGMARLVRDLRRRGAPLDAVGLQSHFTSDWAPERADLAATMRRYARLGVDVEVSELDVEIGAGDAELRRQAAIYGSVAATCRAQPGCARLTTWGFTDASTWLGGHTRPLPFAADGSAKPAWGALRRGLARAG